MMMVMKKAIINECYEHALIEIKVGAAESGDKSWSIHLCIAYSVGVLYKVGGINDLCP